MTHRRIYETIGLRYDDLHKVQAIADDVKAMLGQHPAIDQTQVTFIALSRYSDSSIDLLVQTFCTATETRAFHLAKQDVLLQVAAIIARHGADFAFPTRTLHVKPSNNGTPL
jgi:MscS family membrane protein